MSHEPAYNANFFARLFGVTERRIQILAKEGVLPKTGRGEYPLLQTVKAYVAFLQERVRGHDNQEAKHSYQEEKIKLTRAQREKIDIEIDKMTGELIPRDEYYLSLSTALKTVVAALGSLGDILEREMQLPPECLIRIEEITDALREELNDQVKDVSLSEVP